MVLASPTDNINTKPATRRSGSSDRRIQIEQAKKNSILKRFISYYDVNSASY
jgi:hypothetical protein